MQTADLARGFATEPLQNRILAAFSKRLLDKLAPHLSRIDLPQGFLLVKAEREIHWLYFLERGMASISCLDLAGAPVEVGIVGREGLVGVQALLGQTQTHNTAVMQGAGVGYRIRAEIVREQVMPTGELTQPLHAFLYALLEQTTQLVLCNRLHELEARLARWLLMTSDFMGTRAIHLTQEFLAEMLGVGRPAVTLAAGVLQRNGMISYSRGLVEIVDYEKLQKVTCDCYQMIRQAYTRVYPDLYDAPTPVQKLNGSSKL